MIILLTVVHVLVCFFLIVVVLLQSGKAADLAGAFGGMGSQTAFGPRGAATVLSKATTGAAVLFMITSIWLGIETGRTVGAGQSVIERTGAGEAAAEPAVEVEPQPAGQAPTSEPGASGAPGQGGATPNVSVSPQEGGQDVSVTVGEEQPSEEPDQPQQ